MLYYFEKPVLQVCMSVMSKSFFMKIHTLMMQIPLVAKQSSQPTPIAMHMHMHPIPFFHTKTPFLVYEQITLSIPSPPFPF